MRLKENLRFLLAQQSMTASQLSRATHVPKNTLSSWLAGTAPRNLNQIKAVADCFGVTIDFLLFGTADRSLTVSNNIEQLLPEIQAGKYEVVLRPLNKNI